MRKKFFKVLWELENLRSYLEESEEIIVIIDC